MGFLSPWFLGGLLAASLPLYVHLLRQHRSDPVKFSSVMFLERRTQSSVKHRRLKYLALLAMRLAIILLLALMFANPFIRRSDAAAAGGRKLVVVAVDNSFSMRAGDRFDQAKREALNVLNSVRSGDKGQVLAFASNVQILTQPTNDVEELRRAVNSLRPGDGRSAYGEIARSLRAMGQPDGLPVEAHIITDAQRSSMPAPFSELAVAPSMRLKVHPVASKGEPNWYVESVNAPRSVFQPRKVRVQATVAGAGTDAGEVTVEMAMNGKTLDSKRVNLVPGGRSMVEFYLPDAAYGFNRGEVRVVKGDSLPQDDRFPFSLERKEASKVLFLYDGRSARSVTYFRSAVESVPDSGFSIEAVPVEQARNLDLKKFAAVVLSDVDFEGEIPTGALVAIGPSLSARGRVPLTKTPIRESRYASREGERFLAAGEVDATHPAVARTSGFEAVKFYRTYEVDAGKDRVIARLADRTPLVTEGKAGAARVLVFGSTFDNIANDLPLHASFIPFIEQSLQYLSGVEAAPAHYVVDSFVEAANVVDPDGQRATPLNQASQAQAFRLNREGFFEVRRANGQNELIAVHADRRESDLDVVPQDTLALWQGTGTSSTGGPADAGGESKPYSLWWYFALALLIASLVESLFSGRYLAAQGEQAAARQKVAA